jgi:hypothetical protein
VNTGIHSTQQADFTFMCTPSIDIGFAEALRQKQYLASVSSQCICLSPLRCVVRPLDLVALVPATSCLQLPVLRSCMGLIIRFVALRCPLVKLVACTFAAPHSAETCIIRRLRRSHQVSSGAQRSRLRTSYNNVMAYQRNPPDGSDGGLKVCLFYAQPNGLYQFLPA